MEPQFRFCTSADGTRIAYAICGSGPPLLYARQFSLGMHQMLLWPEARAFYDALAARTTLVTFDRRGTGGAARTVDDLSVEAEARDIAAVADAAGFDRFTLFAEGSAIVPCALYATEHHGRIQQLVLWPTSSGDYMEQARLYRQDWSYARRVVAGVLYPDGPVSLQRDFSRAMKDTLAAEMAARYSEMLGEVDDEPLLSAVSAPALMLSRELIPQMRPVAVRLASLLPNSEMRFVTGNAVTSFPGHEPVAEAVFEFMGLGESSTGRGRFTTVLFTDLVGHTEMMSRLGDARGRDVLREHERITREVLKANGGTEVKTMGDGFMASFGSVTKAVECAVALQRAFDARNMEPGTGNMGVEALSVRVGLNAGEPIEEDGDLFGATVILASRIAAKAEGGEILVADTVRGLCSGKGFLFSDRGEFVAKGFEEPVRVYEVRWRDA
jgi:class 3 adenylate cyclase/pimeloyl-ACP methyl ester carboxylesterase